MYYHLQCIHMDVREAGSKILKSVVFFIRQFISTCMYCFENKGDEMIILLWFTVYP